MKLFTIHKISNLALKLTLAKVFLFNNLNFRYYDCERSFKSCLYQAQSRNKEKSTSKTRLNEASFFL